MEEVKKIKTIIIIHLDSNFTKRFQISAKTLLSIKVLNCTRGIPAETCFIECTFKPGHISHGNHLVLSRVYTASLQN